MKRFGCLLFLFLTLTLISLTSLAPASVISESRDFWNNFNEKTTDFSTAFEQLKQIGEERDFRDFEIVVDVPPEKIPFEDLTAKQGAESEFWYSGAKCRVLVTKESFAFYEKVICPKLHTFLNGIASNVQEKTYTFVRNEYSTDYSGCLIFGLNSEQLSKDLDEWEKPAVVLIQSKKYKEIINSKIGDTFDLDVTIYTLPNAYGEAVHGRNVGYGGRDAYTVVSYNKPDEKDESYRPDSCNIRIPGYSCEKENLFTLGAYVPTLRIRIIFFSPWLNYGSTFETSPTVLYRGEDDLKAVTVSWDKKGNTSLAGAYTAKEKETEEYNSPEKVKEREEEFNRKMEEERQEAIAKTSPVLRIFLFCYSLAVLLITIGAIAIFIYGCLEDKHPAWHWENKSAAIKEVLIITYLGAVCCYMSYSMFYSPHHFWGVWLSSGFFFLPFYLVTPNIWSIFKSTPEERIQNAISDATSDPDTGLFIMIVRPFLKLFLILFLLCAIGGILLHVVFWCRSRALIFQGLYPPKPEEC